MLKNNFPVTLISEKGITNGRLVQVTEKLFEGHAGCATDDPEVIVGFNSPPKGEILAMIVFYKPVSLMKCTIKRTRYTWTADLNGDGVDDIASVSSQYDGISGIINEIIWCTNISGRWITIDKAVDPDCT